MRREDFLDWAFKLQVKINLICRLCQAQQSQEKQKGLDRIF
jgi:hypothetical protein